MFTISFKGAHMDLTPAIRDYAEGKVRMLEKYFAAHEGVFVEIELGKTTEHHQKGDVFRAEVTLKAPRDSYRAEAEKEDLYAAIDVAKDELDTQLKKGSDKKDAMVKKGGRVFKELMRKIGFGE